MWLLDRIEKEDKECYDKIFNDYKTAFRKRYDKHCTYTDAEIREHLKATLEFVYCFKQDFVNELDEDDVIMDNLYDFTAYLLQKYRGGCYDRKQKI